VIKLTLATRLGQVGRPDSDVGDQVEFTSKKTVCVWISAATFTLPFDTGMQETR